jgi:hypothetical protein
MPQGIGYGRGGNPRRFRKRRMQRLEQNVDEGRAAGLTGQNDPRQRRQQRRLRRQNRMENRGYRPGETRQQFQQRTAPPSTMPRPQAPPAPPPQMAPPLQRPMGQAGQAAQQGQQYAQQIHNQMGMAPSLPGPVDPMPRPMPGQGMPFQGGGFNPPAIGRQPMQPMPRGGYGFGQGYAQQPYYRGY